MEVLELLWDGLTTYKLGLLILLVVALYLIRGGELLPNPNRGESSD